MENFMGCFTGITMDLTPIMMFVAKTSFTTVAKPH